MTPRALVEQAIAIIETAERDGVPLHEAAYNRTIQIEERLSEDGCAAASAQMTANRFAAVEVAMLVARLTGVNVTWETW